MIHRSLFGLAIAAGLVACVTGTTSLGGPRGSESSASSTDEAGAADASSTTEAPSDGGWSPPAYASMDAGQSGAWSCAYSWLPVPGPGACEYVFPTERENASPDLDSTTWDPHNVRVDVLVDKSTKAIGAYRETVDDCGSDHGWYNLPSGDGGRATSYALCPTSCAAVTSGGDFRLSAFGWCGTK